MISWQYIVTKSFIDGFGVWDLPLVSGQSISKKIEIKQGRHLNFQKEEPWNKVWNLYSPKPKSPRRNHLSLLCNLELGDKGSNENIKKKIFSVTLDFFFRDGWFFLTLNRQIPPAIYCIHFHIYRNSQAELFFLKGVLWIFSQFTGELPCKRWLQLY